MSKILQRWADDVLGESVIEIKYDRKQKHYFFHFSGIASLPYPEETLSKNYWYRYEAASLEKLKEKIEGLRFNPVFKFGGQK